MLEDASSDVVCSIIKEYLFRPERLNFSVSLGSRGKISGCCPRSWEEFRGLPTVHVLQRIHTDLPLDAVD